MDKSLVRASLLVTAAALLIGAALSCGGAEPLSGTVFDPVRDAPPFTLDDQDGRPVSLDSYDGEVTVVTFLYTYCPDVCPAVTSRLRDAQRLLGEDAARVDFVAVSVDPERDTGRQGPRVSGRLEPRPEMGVPCRQRGGALGCVEELLRRPGAGRVVPWGADRHAADRGLGEGRGRAAA